MDGFLRLGFNRGKVTTALTRFAAVTALLCSAASSADAQNRDVALRFVPSESEVAGYMIYVTDLEAEIEFLLDVGFVPADFDGVARTTVVLDVARSYRVAMTAYNDEFESERSNQILVDAEAPTCDVAFCDDGNACTDAYCSSSTSGCVITPLPDGELCDDGYVDTVDDQCVQGVCEGVLLACRDDFDCDDGNVCNGLELCDGGTVCLEGIPLGCGEQTACAVPRCDPVMGCFTEVTPDGTACDDGLADTQDDACWSGVCEGIPTVGEPTLMVGSLSPGAVLPGRHTIEIYGQGFVLGATLSFVNGEGRPPKVKSLLLVDDRVLEATIDVSRKGPKRTRFFDARVTLPDGRAATLPGALRIDR